MKKEINTRYTHDLLTGRSGQWSRAYGRNKPVALNESWNKKLNTLEESNKHLLDSINYAKMLQQAILPSPAAISSMIGEHFILNKPKDIVSGDFYFVEQIPASSGRDLVAFAVVDCTGHGVPGALMSMLGYGILKGSLNEKTINCAGEVLDHLNKGISQAFHSASASTKVRDGMDISLCVLDKKSKILEFAGANNKGIVIKKDKTLVELKPDRQAIGYDERSKDFNTAYVQLEEGDIVYLFSDGFKDQFGGPQGKKMGYKQFVSKLAEYSAMNCIEQKEILESFFNNWKNGIEQIDDVLVFGLRV